MKTKTRKIKLESCNRYTSNLSQSLNSQYIVGQSHIYHTFRHYILLTPLGFLPKWMNKHTPGLCRSWTYWGWRGQIQPCSERWQLENNFKDQILCKKGTFRPVPTEISHLEFVTLSELNASEFYPTKTSNPALSCVLARSPYLVLLSE